MINKNLLFSVDGKTSGKRRKKAKLKKPEEFMLYKVPEIEECLEFCDSHNATWEVQRQQLRVFCDYMRAAAINAQQKEKKLKKGEINVVANYSVTWGRQMMIFVRLGFPPIR